MNNFGRCPRCEARALEFLETYAHCLECGYSPNIGSPSAPLDDFSYLGSGRKKRADSRSVCGFSVSAENYFILASGGVR